jgi:pimeloyl-ACP methyl ester carboxylesterase
VSTPRSLALPHRVQARTIKTERGDFAALEASPARGVCERRPALLLPGYTGSKEDFLPVLQSLAAAGRRVFAIDQRGQYETKGSTDPGVYQPECLADDVLALAASVADGEAGVHLLGHSLGGLIARQATLADPSAVLSLTLLGSGPASIGGLRAQLLRTTLPLLESAAGGAAGTVPATPDSDAPQRLIEQLWHEQLEPQARAEGVADEIVAFLRDRMLRTSAVGLIAMGRYLLTCADRTAELAALANARILVLYGENDDAWRPTVQDLMARRLRAQRVCIPGAAHSPAVEAPETTAATLTEFWNAAERDSRRHRPVAARHPGPAARGAGDAPAGSG